MSTAGSFSTCCDSYLLRNRKKPRAGEGSDTGGGEGAVVGVGALRPRDGSSSRLQTVHSLVTLEMDLWIPARGKNFTFDG